MPVPGRTKRTPCLSTHCPQTHATSQQARRLKAQNSELRQRLDMLESLVERVGALDAAGAAGGSACVREFLASARAGLY